MSEAIKARYMSDGSEFINGIRACDHTESEYDALTPDERLLMHNTKKSDGKPLFVIRTEAEMHPHAADEAKTADKSAAKKD